MIFRTHLKKRFDEVVQDLIRVKRFAAEAAKLLTPEQLAQVEKRVSELEASDDDDTDRPFGGRVK